VLSALPKSSRKLALGLKKETADMYITNMSWNRLDYIDDWQICSISYCDEMSFLESNGVQLEKTAWSIIPAWSLHRLLELVGFPTFGLGKTISKDYDYIISAIEHHINEGIFNHDYLEEEK
jgi:hypothetical protein